jgi:hypothetical protein
MNVKKCFLQVFLTLTIQSCGDHNSTSQAPTSLVDQKILIGSWISGCQLYTLGRQTAPLYSISTWTFSSSDVAEVGALYRDSACTDKQSDMKNSLLKYKIVASDNLLLIPIDFSIAESPGATVYDVVRIQNGSFYRGTNDQTLAGSSPETRVKTIETRMSWKKK